MGALCTLASEAPKALYDVMLSTGKLLQGELSPIDEEADYIRINPRAAFDDDKVKHVIHVPLAHIVYVQRRQ
jgi:hypothetical protein